MDKNNVAISPSIVKPTKIARPARTLPATDAGNAEWFAHLNEKFARYDHKRRRWLMWREHWWVEDQVESVVQMAKRAARLRFEAAASLPDEDRNREQKWARTSESRFHLEATLTLARSERALTDDGTGWDVDPMLLGVANGVVDLRTGRLRVGKQSDKITQHVTILFDPAAPAPRWERFVREIFNGDADLIAYVHRAAGYSITGDVREQCLFLCCGPGANGKSTFLRVLLDVMGGYACNLPFSALELKARADIPSEIAGVAGRRFVTAIETNEYAQLNEARIKALTGGDPVTARFLHKEWFTYNPSAKYWLAFNSKPHVADDSEGFWRRIRVIPFVRQFTGEDADPTLATKLAVEAPGILAWIVRGCLAWQAHGLKTPDRVKAETTAYREEADPLADYIEEQGFVHPRAMGGAAALWLDYDDWNKKNGERNALNRRAFTRALIARGFTKARVGHDRTWVWIGICRKIDAEAQHLV